MKNMAPPDGAIVALTDASASSTDASESNNDWLAEAFEQHHQKLAQYASTLLGNNSHAVLDAVQETFMRLCKQPHESVADHIQPWLFRTCRNFIFDQFRQKKIMKTLDETANVIDRRGGDDPVAKLQQVDDLQRCCSEISKLPTQQQEILQLRMSHGMSYKQIAAVTGLTVTNVGVTLHTAIHKLRANLAT